MKIVIEKLEKSKRGIEISAFVEEPHCDRVAIPDIPADVSIEKRENMLIPYRYHLKEAEERYKVAMAEYLRLHLNEATLTQLTDEDSGCEYRGIETRNDKL